MKHTAPKDTHVQNLSLSPRLLKALLRNNVLYLCELSDTSDVTLLSFYQLGKKSLEEVHDVLENSGYTRK